MHIPSDVAADSRKWSCFSHRSLRPCWRDWPVTNSSGFVTFGHHAGRGGASLSRDEFRSRRPRPCSSLRGSSPLAMVFAYGCLSCSSAQYVLAFAPRLAGAVRHCWRARAHRSLITRAHYSRSVVLIDCYLGCKALMKVPVESERACVLPDCQCRP